MGDDSEDFTDVIHGCPICGTLETQMSDPIRVEIDPNDEAYDVTAELVFCSESCHREWQSQNR